MNRPPGKSEVIFHFKPRFFYFGLYGNYVGLCLFLLLASGLYFFGNRLGKMRSIQVDN